MKRIFAAMLLSPVLLQAQVGKTAGIHLDARADALKNALPAVEGNNALRVSTGVLSAKVLSSATIVYSGSELNPTDNRIVASVMVDEQGVPHDAKIVSSLNPILNQRVLEAVSQYRFTPAQLDGQAIAERVNITFVFQR